MARGQRKSIDEKIAAKQEVISALMVRLESEKKELAQMREEKKKKELEAVTELIASSGLSPEEVTEMIQQYMENREESVS